MFRCFDSSPQNNGIQVSMNSPSQHRYEWNSWMLVLFCFVLFVCWGVCFVYIHLYHWRLCSCLCYSCYRLSFMLKGKLKSFQHFLTWMALTTCLNLSLMCTRWGKYLWKWMKTRTGANHVTNTFVVGSAKTTNNLNPFDAPLIHMAQKMHSFFRFNRSI